MKKRIIAAAISMLALGSNAQDSTALFTEPDFGPGIPKRYANFNLGPGSNLLLSADWTIESLIKLPVGVNSSQIHIVESYSLSAAQGGFVLRVGNQRVLAYVMVAGTNYPLSGNMILPENEWVHIAAAYNETTGDFSIYVNGSLDNSTTLTADQFTNTTEMRIGARGDDADMNQTCIIDEVRIWDVARDSSDIQSTIMTCLTGTEPGLLAYYNFEHDSNGTVVDITPNGNDGTIVNDLGAGSYTYGAFSCSTASIDKKETTEVSIYPNPASSTLTIDLDQLITKVEIYTVNGLLVLSEKSSFLNIDKLNSGMYLINISTEYGMKQMKFLKK